MKFPVLISSIPVLATLALAACGGGSEESSTTSTGALAETGCSEVETVDVPLAGNHEQREFTSDDYETNPPAGGDHNPDPIELGQFYPDPPPLGESVHALEHGAVIGWTNDLSPEDQTAVEKAFNDEFVKGYESLAVVENPDLETPFALSSWGALQSCASVDPAAITSFIEEHYAADTTSEGSLACAGRAAKLPACSGS